VTHIENATSADPELRLANVVAINRTKFIARWEVFLNSTKSGQPDLISLFPESVATVTDRPRVAIYSPYNFTPGGGERYILTIAEAFRDAADVALITPRPFSRTRILTMGRELGLDLDHIEVIPLYALLEYPPFDLSFVLGNEIFPRIGRLAKRNIFMCQFPFPLEGEDQIPELRPNWDGYDLLLTNSPFTQRHASRLVDAFKLPPRPIEVLSPPVPLQPVGRNKRAQILHVGRFFTGGHCKRQDILIEAFRKLHGDGLNAELHLAGSLHPEAEHRDYYAGLIDRASGLPVHFHVNCTVMRLRELYQQSLAYWHATGFGEDAIREPHKMEHFGISLVEAMSAGCIPIVFGEGGPVEIVEHGVSGFHFRTIDQLCALTRKVMVDMPKQDIARMTNAAVQTAQSYSDVAFKAKILALAKRLLPVRVGAIRGLQNHHAEAAGVL
jgi:glycosyltransferase involved in cell wall biosynthesis